MCDNEHESVKHLFNVRKTVITCLKDRGYNIPSSSEKLSFEDFVILFNQDMHHLYYPKMEPIRHIDEKQNDDGGGGILVYFESLKKIDLHHLQTRITQINKNYPKLDKLFFVLKTYGEEKAKKINKFIHEELSKHPNIEMLENIYPFDFMKNNILPECCLLSEQEKNAVVEFLKTPLHNFPKIEKTDPISIRFNAKPNDMFYFKQNGGLEIRYRVVI